MTNDKTVTVSRLLMMKQFLHNSSCDEQICAKQAKKKTQTVAFLCGINSKMLLHFDLELFILRCFNKTVQVLKRDVSAVPAHDWSWCNNKSTTV